MNLSAYVASFGLYVVCTTLRCLMLLFFLLQLLQLCVYAQVILIAQAKQMRVIVGLDKSRMRNGNFQTRH